MERSITSRAFAFEHLRTETETAAVEQPCLAFHLANDLMMNPLRGIMLWIRWQVCKHQTNCQGIQAYPGLHHTFENFPRLRRDTFMLCQLLQLPHWCLLLRQRTRPLSPYCLQ
jgi:hypothetical protein